MNGLGGDVFPGNIGIEQRKRERNGIYEDDFSKNLSYNESRECTNLQKTKLIKLGKNYDFSKNKSTNCDGVFSLLCDEIILSIFNFFTHNELKIAAQVSSRFRRLTYDESLWTRIDLASKTLKSDALAFVIKRGVKILRLKETKVNSPIWSKIIDHRIVDSYSKIEYLDMSYCLISITDLSTLLSKCRKLKKLSLESCQLDIAVCTEIAKNHDLNTLNLAMVEGLNSKGLKIICTNCKRLESINLGWTKINNEAINSFINNISSEVLNLNLSGHQYLFNDEKLWTLVNRCPKIRELDISDCLELTSASIISLTVTLPNIKALSISRCYKIDPKVILSSIQHLTELRSLNAFRQINNQDARDLETRFNLLRVNKEYFSTVARPTVGLRRSSIWLL